MNKRTCSVEDCARPSRKRGWCELHYSRWRRNGSVEDAGQSWIVGVRGDCIVCGNPVPPDIGFRRYCGRSCAVMAHNSGYLGRSKSRPCSQCGKAINLLERHPSGRMKYSSASTCWDCKKPTNLRRFLPAIIVRDGIACGICGVDVDLSLQYPDQMSSSVDHVVPRSLAGPDLLSNFQLSHFVCNRIKSNRISEQPFINRAQ